MFYIGCPLWGYKEWVGNFLPAHTPARDFLRLYSRRLTAVEGNTIFYALPSAAALYWNGADRAEFDAGVPQCVRPLPQQLLHLLGPGIGGEVQVSAEAAQQRVAHAAADEVQLVAGVGEYPAELAEHRLVAAQRDGGARQ